MTETPVKLTIDISNLESQVHQIVQAQSKTSENVQRIFELADVISHIDKKINKTISDIVTLKMNSYIEDIEKRTERVAKLQRREQTIKKRVEILQGRVMECKSILKLDKVFTK